MTWHRARRAGLGVVVPMAAVLVLAGCADDGGSAEGPVAYEEPAWMAEEALAQERYSATWVECMREHGQGGDVAPDGTISGTFPEDMDEAARAAAAEARATAAAACQERVAEFEPDEPPSWDLVYDRALDTDACLRHEGYPDLPEPPSRAVFVEEHSTQGAGGGGEVPWMPFAALHEARPDITADEWYRLKDACTEFWVRYSAPFQGEDS